MNIILVIVGIRVIIGELTIRVTIAEAGIRVTIAIEAVIRVVMAVTLAMYLFRAT